MNGLPKMNERSFGVTKDNFFKAIEIVLVEKLKYSPDTDYHLYWDCMWMIIVIENTIDLSNGVGNTDTLKLILDRCKKEHSSIEEKFKNIISLANTKNIPQVHSN